MESLGVKVVLLGESAVGKTSIVNLVHGGEYVPDQSSTIGACFQIHKMKVDDNVVNLHLWDTAGQERFRALAPMYYRDANYALLVYAIDNFDSFNSISEWYEGLQTDCQEMPHIILLGNKKDLESNRQISYIQGEELAKSINASFYEVSAKNDDGSLGEIFLSIAKESLQEQESTSAQQSVQFSHPTPEKKGCC